MTAERVTIEDVQAAMARHYEQPHGGYESPREAINQAVWSWAAFEPDVWATSHCVDDMDPWERRLDELMTGAARRMEQLLRDAILEAAEAFMAEYPDAPRSREARRSAQLP